MATGTTVSEVRVSQGVLLASGAGEAGDSAGALGAGAGLLVAGASGVSVEVVTGTTVSEVRVSQGVLLEATADEVTVCSTAGVEGDSVGWAAGDEGDSV